MFLPAPDSVQVVLHDLTRVRIAGWLVGASAFGVPLLAIILLARWRAGGTRTRRAVLRTFGSLMAAAYGLLAAGAAADWDRSSEAPVRARLVRALGAPVIEALERYRDIHGTYPSTLDELVPAHLAPSVLRAPEQSLLANPFEYEPTAHRYILRLREAPPGISGCEFASVPRRWYCSGYF